MKHKRIWNNKIYLKKAILIKWEIWDFKMRIKCYFWKVKYFRRDFKMGLGKKNEFINIHEHLD